MPHLDISKKRAEAEKEKEKSQQPTGNQAQQPTGNPETETPTNPDGDPLVHVTQKDFEELVAEINTGFKSVEETMAALEQSLSDDDTPAQRQEKVGKQLADAKAVNQRNKVAVNQEETFDSNVLFKGIKDNTPPDLAMDIINKTFVLPTDSDVIQQWQRKLTEIKILSECLKIKPQDLKAWKAYEMFLEASGIAEKFVATGTAPANYIPTGWSNELLQYFYQELEVAALFTSFPMPQNPFDWKLRGRAKAVRRMERTETTRTRGTDDPTPQKPAQGNVRFEAEVMMVPIEITEEFNEDMIMGYMDTLIREDIPGSMAEGFESALINGDGAKNNDGTANHQDDGYTDADVETCWDGIRKVGHERSANVDLSTYNFSGFTKVIRKGGKYTVKPRRGVWLMSNSTYTQCLDFDQVKTLDKMNMPTNVTGAINVIHGRPVIVSGEYPEDLDATGVVSATEGDNTKTGFSHINRDHFRIGTIREERVQMEFDIRLQTWVIISTCRKAFNTRENRREGYTPTINAVNITSAP